MTDLDTVAIGAAFAFLFICGGAIVVEALLEFASMIRKALR